jgi:propionyl-CoA carboxylase alpha chain
VARHHRRYPAQGEGRKHIKVDGDRVDIALEYTPGDRLVIADIDGAELAVKLAKTRTGWRMTTRGRVHDVRVLSWRVAGLAKHMIEKVPPDLSKFLICPMPGLLVSLHVAAGDKVEAGQPLATVEAMKMENILRAERAGVVAKINAAQGDSLAVDAVILEMDQ